MCERGLERAHARAGGMTTNGNESEFKRILVTGGAGFLGSALCRRLVAEGHDVIALDNFFTSQKTNLTDLLDKPNFELVRHDVTQPFFIECDQIYNLACPASPVHYQFNPVKTMKTSVMGMMNMLGLAKRVKARILQASTSEVYGDPDVTPQPETYWGHVNCTGVRSCYDEGKRAAETLCFDYHRQNDVDVRVIRIFNTYGPGMHPYDGRVVSNFIVQALNGQDITIYGDGSQTRSFCFVDDLIEGIIRFMNQDEYIGPMNLGNPTEFTIKQLAEKTIAMTGSKSKLIHQPLPNDDPKQRRCARAPSPCLPRCSGLSCRPPGLTHPPSRAAAHAQAGHHHRSRSDQMGAEGEARRWSEGHHRLLLLGRHAHLQEADQARCAHQLGDGGIIAEEEAQGGLMGILDLRALLSADYRGGASGCALAPTPLCVAELPRSAHRCLQRAAECVRMTYDCQGQ